MSDARRARPLSQRIGIFGGTFDPVHIAHLIIAQEAAARADLDQVIFVPSGHPPHKQAQAVSTASDRLAMVKLAVAGNERFAVSTVEIDRPGPSYTVETLHQLRETHPVTTEWFLIMGGDMVEDFPSWHDPQGILHQLHGIIAIVRPGFPLADEQLLRLDRRLSGVAAKLIAVEAPQLAISSTQLRQRVAQHLPLHYLIPDAVVSYIHAERLYVANNAFEPSEGEKDS